MSTKQKRSSKSPVIILSACVAVLTVAVLVIGAITAHLWQKENAQDNQQIAHLIIDAVDKLSQPLLRDASNKQYIPESRLAFPAPAQSLGALVYGYIPGPPETIQLASKNSIAAAKFPLLSTQSSHGDIFTAMPKLQSCARGIQITFSPINRQNAAATKMLTNGKTAYFYTEKLCLNTQLLAYVQQIESY